MEAAEERIVRNASSRGCSVGSASYELSYCSFVSSLLCVGPCTAVPTGVLLLHFCQCGGSLVASLDIVANTPLEQHGGLQYTKSAIESPCLPLVGWTP